MKVTETMRKRLLEEELVKRKKQPQPWTKTLYRKPYLIKPRKTKEEKEKELKEKTDALMEEPDKIKAAEEKLISAKVLVGSRKRNAKKKLAKKTKKKVLKKVKSKVKVKKKVKPKTKKIKR
ncbi:MAG: hypothetical protein ABH821_03265 [archaeon]